MGMDSREFHVEFENIYLRKAYYDALEAWDSDQNLDPLRDFLRSQTEKTWEKQMVRIAKKKSSCCPP